VVEVLRTRSPFGSFEGFVKELVSHYAGGNIEAAMTFSERQLDDPKGRVPLPSPFSFSDPPFQIDPGVARLLAIYFSDLYAFPFRFLLYPGNSS
jgi:hypothetical protein